jgi:hypothetical protein
MVSTDVAATLVENGMYNEDGYVILERDRPAINPNFNPDYSCLFDVYQLKCIPGSEQECPKNFGNNEDSTYFPLDRYGDWTCPDGYHSVDDDETGQCYRNEEGCEYEGMMLLTDRPGKGDRCASIDSICSYENHTVDICITNPPVTFVDDELNCSDVLNQQAINFKVPEDDEVRQNFDSDNDGIGCEAKEDIGFSSNENALLHQ